MELNFITILEKRSKFPAREKPFNKNKNHLKSQKHKEMMPKVKPCKPDRAHTFQPKIKALHLLSTTSLCQHDIINNDGDFSAIHEFL